MEKAFWLKLQAESFPKEMAKVLEELMAVFDKETALKKKFNEMGTVYVNGKLGEFAKAIASGKLSDEQKNLAINAIEALNFDGSKLKDGFNYNFSFRYGPAVTSVHVDNKRGKKAAKARLAI